MNEQADLLVNDLAHSSWMNHIQVAETRGNKNNTSNPMQTSNGDLLASTPASESSNTKDDANSLQLERLMIYVRASHEKISFPLVFYRYKRVDMIIQIAAVSISSIIPIIQKLVLTSSQ